MTQVTELVVQGISTGAIYGLVALGLVLSCMLSFGSVYQVSM